MFNINIENLIEIIKQYNLNDVELIYKAYKYAEFKHDGQIRQSGEPYITHPLNVAYILAEMKADKSTICAAILHDTLEDTTATKKELIDLFGNEIANLVDGVTKINKMYFSSKAEENLANTRKIVTSITDDVRIIIIKLADRLHNMRTLQFKSESKQKEISLETLKIFVPLAYCLGIYKIKNELEDISFKYLNPNEYKKIENILSENESNNKKILCEMLENIDEILSCNSIPHEIKTRVKNIYSIYKKQNEGYKINDIHDLLSLKIIVDEIINCYVTLGCIHTKYNPLNDKFKDYICNPKTNLYQSLHSTVFGPENRLIQTQIRTTNMDKIASYGLAAYWGLKKGDIKSIMQKDLKNKFQFFKILEDINDVSLNNQDFVDQIKKELFADKIYVYTHSGYRIELPKGSTIVDYAYNPNINIKDKIKGAKINDEYITDLGYTLKNKDRIIAIKDKTQLNPKEELINKVHTNYAKKKIIGF